MSSNANNRFHKFLNGVASALMILALCFGMSSPPAAHAREADSRTPAEALVPPLFDTASAISSHLFHTCALTTVGGIKCWGDNTFGQLGDGTGFRRYKPVDVYGLSSGVSAIGVGGTHSCALTSAGGVKCWGLNNRGQLGDDTGIDSNTPVDVYGLTKDVSAIAGGNYHTCALTSGGGVKCWGDNTFGALGDGTTTQRLKPVAVYGLTSGVIAITAGWYFTCALTSGGGVKCWGDNTNGKLGDGTTTNRLKPVDVSGLASGVSLISANYYHVCARTSAGGAKCWGSGGSGELGDGTYDDRWTPVDVSGLTSGVSTVSAGGNHTCALTSVGGVKCWGNGGDGQLGDGDHSGHPTPVDVFGFTSGASSVAAGLYHTCALTAINGIMCWGGNDYSQVGDGTTTDRFKPVYVFGFSGYPIPPAPVLISPSGTISEAQPVYSWNASTGAASYRLSVWSEGSASYIILADVASSSCLGGICSTQPAATLVPGAYRFKVVARNVAGSSPYSAWMNFTLSGGGVPPAAPVLISPSGAISDAHPPYVWNASSGATAYSLAVYSEGLASYVILTNISSPSCPGDICTYHPATILDAGAYKFKVLARNAAGPSPYSAWMNFTVPGGLPPDAPAPVSPDGTIFDIHPPYIWNASSGATVYTLEVYSESSLSYVIQVDVSSTYCTSAVCSYHPSTLLSAGIYRFRVLARNAGGPSPYSPWMNFTVARPDAPVLISPSGTISDTHPPYSWNASNSAVAYRLAVYSEGAHSYIIIKNIPISSCTGGVCTTHPTTELPAGDYRFKVLARNAVGLSPYSLWMHFTVSP